MSRNNLFIILSPIVLIFIFIVVIFTCQVKTTEEIQLEAPFSLKAKVKPKSVQLSWKWHGSSVGISGFVLERKTENEEYKSIGLTSGFSFEDWQPPLEKIYSYRVTFFQGEDKSLPSQEVKVNLITKVAETAKPTESPKPTGTTTPKITEQTTPQPTLQKIKTTPTPALNLAKPSIVKPFVEEETKTPGKPTPHPFEALYKTVIDTPRNARSGYIWFTPVSSIVYNESEFIIEVHANTGNQRLAAYGFEIKYDKISQIISLKNILSF